MTATEQDNGQTDREQNPLVKAIRRKRMDELARQGVSREAAQETIRAYMQDTVRPVLAQARSDARAKSLKGEDKDRYVDGVLKKTFGLA